MLNKNQVTHPVFIVDASVILRLCLHNSDLIAKLFMSDNPVDPQIIFLMAQKFVKYV